MENHRRSENGTSPETLAVVLEHVRSALQGLRFGHVTLIVQDGKVVQVDRFEKTRISAS